MDRGVLLVTGGSRGIGAAVALSAAAEGWAVCLTYRRDQAAAAAVVARIERGGGRALAVRADVADEPDVIGAFRAAEALGPLAVLVANAGIVSPVSRIEELSHERVSRMMAVNVVGTIICCREAVKRLSRAHGGAGGSIVILSSGISRVGGGGEYVDYAASKGALDTLGIGLAREVAGDGIRVNVVRPGVIDTDMHASGGRPDRVAQQGPSFPMRRAGRPAEVAAAVLWLAGDSASYCSGTVMDVGGAR